MSGFGFDPFGLQKPFGLEPRQDGIQRAFGDLELRLFREGTQDFQPVQARLPEACQDGHFETSIAQLCFPVLPAIAVTVASAEVKWELADDGMSIFARLTPGGSCPHMGIHELSHIAVPCFAIPWGNA